MIWFLRYIGIHLWITTLICIPVSFYLLPALGVILPGTSPVTLGVWIFLFFLVTGAVITDRIAGKWVAALIREGQSWEHSGIVEKARTHYLKALRIYDTFLLWPFSARKTALEISRAMARLELNTRGGHPNFTHSILIYLKLNPDDIHMAGLWLSRIHRTGDVTAADQEVLTVLAQKHGANPSVNRLLADIFLNLNRNDFTAMQLYAQVMNQPGTADTFQDRIQAVMPMPEAGLTLKETYAADSMTRAAGLPPHPPDPGRDPIRFTQGAAALWKLIVSGVSAVFATLRSDVNRLVSGVRKIVVYLRTHRTVRSHIKTGLFALMGIGLAIFTVNTIFHTVKTRPVEQPQIDVEEPVIPHPFTIQVAAYLKQSHAQRYVDQLKKKQIDASIKTVEGGGKTWFVVKVSAFADKQRATEYGRKLKQQNIIDDFFVTNR